MIRPTLDKILVDPAVAATPIARAVSRNAGGVEVIEAPAGGVEEALRRLGLTEGKRVLLVKEFRGRSFKQCQGLKEEYACCNLHTLAEGNGCAMECTYCILQHYMTSQHLTVFANVDDLQAEIQRAVSSEPIAWRRFPRGISRAPGIRPISHSYGSRTSMSAKSS